jgi:UDP-glucuronate 4-epimerase
MKIIVTGAAGFIGGHVSDYLANLGHEVTGFDNISSYYAPKMKRAHLSQSHRVKFEEVDVNDRDLIFKKFQSVSPDVVVHLAAQGGVRASRVDPMPYLTTNQIGFVNVLQACEKFNVKKFIYASSSSVYGEGLQAPFREDSVLPAPKSLYALSKISNENISKNLPSDGVQRIGLRFFTVYGPWGRPDMAVFRLLASTLLGMDFVLTANLEVKRDFTFVSDVSKTIDSLIKSELVLKSEIFNVAGNSPYSLSELFKILDSHRINPTVRVSEPDSMDVNLTHGSTEKLDKFSLSIPKTSLNDGILETWEWIQTIDPVELREWFEYSSQ